MVLLQEEHRLNEIVRLVGRDTLSDLEQLMLEAARSIREDFLQQNAFHAEDTFTSMDKQHRMLDMILQFFDLGKAALENGAYLEDVLNVAAREAIARIKFLSEKNLPSQLEKISARLVQQLAALKQEGDETA